MNTKEDIHIKLELTKDTKHHSLTLTAHLNPQAPNISAHEDHISWTFTDEEIDFLYDAITLLKDKKQTSQSFQKTIQTPFPTKTTDAAIDATINKHTGERQSTPDTQETIDAIIRTKTG
jgi:hypothetical protein